MPDDISEQFPKVSVIIPTYNRADLLPRAVNSVLSQTYQDYEIIIVDDCSSDPTPEVIANFDGCCIRSLRHNKTKKASAARNTGIANARGEYIAFLDDDDEWLPTYLERQVAILDSSPPSVGLVYCWVDMVEDSTGKSMPSSRSIIAGDILDDSLALNIPGQTSVWTVRSSVAQSIGGFDENLTRYDDADFICRLAQRYQVAVLPEVAVKSHFDHNHEQMGHDTLQNTSAAASFIRSHMLRFADALSERPRARATLLRRLAALEIELGNRRAGIVAFASSFILDPIGVIRAVIKNHRLAVKIFARSLRNPSGATQK